LRRLVKRGQDQSAILRKRVFFAACRISYSRERCGHDLGFARGHFENSRIDVDQMMVGIFRASTAEALEGAATIVIGFVIVRMIRTAPR
jgi:hypothetical protein